MEDRSQETYGLPNSLSISVVAKNNLYYITINTWQLLLDLKITIFSLHNFKENFNSIKGYTQQHLLFDIASFVMFNISKT